MIRLLLVVGAQVALLSLCHTLAAPHWARVVQAPADLLAAPAGELSTLGLHLGAVAAGWWVLFGTLHDLVVSVHESRNGRRDRGHRLAPRWAQRLISQAVGTALVIGVAAGPSAATTTGAAATHPAAQVIAPPVPLIEQPDLPVDQTPPVDGALPVDVGEVGGVGDAPGDVGDAPGDEARVEPEPGAPPEPGPGASGVQPDLVHTVAAGENLWVIARVHLSADGRTPSDREVHAYWLQLIGQNQPALRSGDPDLIFPGERLQLPPVGAVGATADAVEADR